VVDGGDAELPSRDDDGVQRELHVTPPSLLARRAVERRL
jgi:hypothetical protein